MIKVLFICHGNICRSPMAEYVMTDLVKKAGLSDWIEVASAATSREEIGNDVHYGTKTKLAEVGVACPKRAARQMTKQDYAEYDYLIGMDSANIRNMTRIADGDAEHKIHLLLEYAGEPSRQLFFQKTLFFFGCTAHLAGSEFPDQGSNPCPLRGSMES